MTISAAELACKLMALVAEHGDFPLDCKCEGDELCSSPNFLNGVVDVRLRKDERAIEIISDL